MLSYYIIYCEKFRKVLQRTEKVALVPVVLLVTVYYQSIIKLIKVTFKYVDMDL